MKKNKNSNSGFTLVELIIAISMLAFIMTAVVSVMSAGVVSYKKAKADVSVHNDAQAVYNELTDAVMSANNMVVLAYINEGKKSVDFSIPGENIASDIKLSSKPYYLVKDEEAQHEFEKTSEYKARPEEFKLYSEVKKDAELYVLAIVTERGVDIDISECKAQNASSDLYYDAYAIEKGVTGLDIFKKISISKKKKPDGTESSEDRVDRYGNVVYDKKDSMRSVYTFDEKTMYNQRKYQFMVGKNSYFGWHEGVLTGSALEDDSMFNYVYSDSFSYVKLSDTESLSGIIANIDANAGTVKFDLKFNSKNMTYESTGLTQARNSYVLKPQGSRLQITVGDTTEDTSEETSEETSETE